MVALNITAHYVKSHREKKRKKYALPKEGAGAEEMPTSLGEAIEVARKSKFLRETLGEHIYESLLRNKEIEWENYRHHISQYELKKDLPTL
jgi:glutamine synthetase